MFLLQKNSLYIFSEFHRILPFFHLVKRECYCGLNFYPLTTKLHPFYCQRPKGHFCIKSNFLIYFVGIHYRLRKQMYHKFSIPLICLSQEIMSEAVDQCDYLMLVKYCIARQSLTTPLLWSAFPGFPTIASWNVDSM